MTLIFFRRLPTIRRLLNIRLAFRDNAFYSWTPTLVGNKIEAHQSSMNFSKTTSAGYCRGLYISPFLPVNGAIRQIPEIELVDDETWRLSSGLAGVWTEKFESKAAFSEQTDEELTCVPKYKEVSEFDDIEDMRIRGNLFYKIDRNSREFEEYSFDFHRRKPSTNKCNRSETKKGNTSPKAEPSADKSRKEKDKVKSNRKDATWKSLSPLEKENLLKLSKQDHLIPSLDKNDSSIFGKRQRIPTFNQLTAPYHEPFCLDVYISKGSIRACIVHRGTSKVVAVAHSISKDMKFDLSSTKNRAACVAVGEVLAQRALADDIHNVVYTPRKGEKIEGKLQIVVQSIADNGIHVKIKLKQKKHKKTGQALLH